MGYDQTPEDIIEAERERVACLVETAMRHLAAAIRAGDVAPPRRKRTVTRTDTPTPVKDSGITADEAACVDRVWGLYPPRPEPYPFVPVRNAILQLLREGVPARTLIEAAMRYSQDVQRRQVEPQYVMGMVRFYRDGLWKGFANGPMVFGRSREEWARSGQDVLEFDRLAGEIVAKETMA
jgi:hypothetical protein